MLNYNDLPDTMYFGASERKSELKNRVFLTPHIGIASLFIIDVDDLFAQFPEGHSYKCNISYRQWEFSNDLLASPLENVNALHNIAEYKDKVVKGQSSGFIHTVDISKVKDKLSLFDTNDPDREVIYNGEEPLIITECIPHTVQWDFSFSQDEVAKHGPAFEI